MRTTSRSGVVTGLTALLTAWCVGTAAASPPVPLITRLDDMVRAKVVAGGTVSAPARTDTSYGTYTLGPGAHSGWRRLAGSGLLGVAEGELTVRSAAGCAARRLAAGEAAVLPPGRYLFAAGGDGPAVFGAAFVGIPRGGAEPLRGPGTGAAACGTGASGGQSPAVTAHVRGTFAPAAAYGHSGQARARRG